MVYQQVSKLNLSPVSITFAGLGTRTCSQVAAAALNMLIRKAYDSYVDKTTYNYDGDLITLPYDVLLKQFCLFCCFTSQVNNYGHGGTGSSSNHTLTYASLNKQLTSTSGTYFGL